MKRTCLLLLGVLLGGCARPEVVGSLEGKTMGTTYQVTYVAAGLIEGQQKENLADSIEGLLAEINQSLSTYIATSTISQINDSEDLAHWHPLDRHFEVVFRRSREVYGDTNHAFNPAVGPLVDAWGFGPPEPEDPPTATEVAALLRVVDFESFQLREDPLALRKQIKGARLDFSAIAKGYAVDAIGTLLEQRGVQDYLVEIGGEIRARGQREEKHAWRVGIERPADHAVSERDILMAIDLENSGLATSGNYRNYRIENGKKIAHIIDPSTGYPAQNSLLSVSVVAPDTMTADAYATALMVMGLDEGLRFLEGRRDLSAYFVATDDSGQFIEKRSSAFPAAAKD